MSLLIYDKPQYNIPAKSGLHECAILYFKGTLLNFRAFNFVKLEVFQLEQIR